MAHRCLYTQKFYTPKFLHRENFTHRSICTEKSLHRGAFTHRRVYTQKLLHTETFRQKFYTQDPLHTDVLMHRNFYTENFLHSGPFQYFTPVFDVVRPSFLAKRLHLKLQNQTFTPFLEVRPSFRAKRLHLKLQILQFYHRFLTFDPHCERVTSNTEQRVAERIFSCPLWSSCMLPNSVNSGWWFQLL